MTAAVMDKQLHPSASPLTPITDRDALIRDHLGLAYNLAARYARPGGGLREDLRQVAAEALIKAADRYDPGRGVPFHGFAMPYINGSLKRYFRDQTWAVRPPRRLQEHALAVSAATEELSQRTGRAPTVAELTEHMGLSAEEVLDALECGTSYRPEPLYSMDLDRLNPRAHLHTDGGAEKAENLMALAPMMAALSERDRRMLSMRFGAEMTQTQIAAELGISQMQVSRLLSQCLHRLRRQLTGV